MRIDGCFKKSFIICIPSWQQQFLQCRTKQALRPGAQAKAIWPEIGAAAVLSSSTDEMPEPKLRWRKQVVSLLQRAQQRLYTVEARACASLQNQFLRVSFGISLWYTSRVYCSLVRSRGGKQKTPPVVSRAGFSLCASSVLSSGRLGPHNLAWEIFLLRQIAELLAIGRPLRAGFFRHIH